MFLLLHLLSFLAFIMKCAATLFDCAKIYFFLRKQQQKKRNHSEQMSTIFLYDSTPISMIIIRFDYFQSDYSF